MRGKILIAIPICEAKNGKDYAHDFLSFGPPNLERYPFMGMGDNSLDGIELETKGFSRKKGYSRIEEKINEIRQHFSQAVISERRSGSGNVVLEFYDDLVKLWGGSPATESLPCGIGSEDTI